MTNRPEWDVNADGGFPELDLNVTLVECVRCRGTGLIWSPVRNLLLGLTGAAVLTLGAWGFYTGELVRGAKTVKALAVIGVVVVFLFHSALRYGFKKECIVCNGSGYEKRHDPPPWAVEK